MKINFDAPHQRYPTVFVVLAFTVQIIVMTSLYVANSQYGYGALYLLLSFYFLGITSLWLYLSYPEKKINFIIYNVIFIPYFLWQFFCFLIAIPYLIYFFLYLCLWLTAPTYLSVLNYLINGLALLVFALVNYGLFYFPNKLKFSNIKIKHPNNKLKNYKIIHLSDLHIGNFLSQKYLEKIGREVNQSQADLIFITGDLLTYGNHFMDDAVAFIAKLKAKDGIIFSLGNHEYYVDTAELISKLKSIGCIVLCTEVYVNETLSVGAISGITDNLSKGKKELQEILIKNKNNPPDFLLAHDPIIFQESSKFQVPLTLSGHTHGGQIKIPFTNIIATYFYKDEYIAGMYCNANSYLYVHQGVGMSGLPFRLGISPEVVLFTLE